MPAMTRLLAVDTSAGRGSVALLDGGSVLTDYSDEPRSHTRRLEPMVNGLLAQSGLRLGDLDALAFGAGPGSFTGLRVTAGLVQGLAFGLQLPVVPVSSLRAMAHAVHGRLDAPAEVAVARDARMGELYWGLYRVTPEAAVEPLLPDSLVSPAALSLPETTSVCLGVGDGWLLREAIPDPVLARMETIMPDVMPEAGAIACLAETLLHQGEWVGAEAVQPVYLRDDVAWQTSA
ncbi:MULTISPECIES: tRNA (adenosine(37)-N6)-threonylcarbamoyltransferase complex dimerization subunit type 1 TsaB [Halomonadaceae]|uniref:tRNA threonylcarbamoyladenosine biosynthesis protein TsaB n=1 Tax=Vreelandella halophila TaxID=86177 RepID=A0A9X4YBY1_9GAMM|nr:MULTISPECIES: tRNA (adenosine(37)-N6)-threonylcarbamoyltransferase complex dimerization subunit type 1 TsaB [Halomonas]MYL26403.1 tRNA (adenosine(37)-N6)-threonylcarbamoyltransferase complex dimerization subunit type 1 TsaB [Halomonas utahensis]MYL73740.1 tRNA (adenosine(37)-N6)-threonylcarbamoyltransferase complex dimerization subunit type 1 TsaB [Halomonas sp. 22501_18_FS]